MMEINKALIFFMLILILMRNLINVRIIGSKFIYKWDLIKMSSRLMDN